MASVMSYSDIMHHTANAWEELPLSVFQAAWVVCGYFQADHFQNADAGVSTVEGAKHLLEPAGVLEGSTIIPTPQYCATYDWKIEDYRI